MWQKLKNAWNGLPHQAQAAIVLFGTSAYTVIKPVIVAWANNQAVCFSGSCLKHLVVAAAQTGAAAVFGLYLKSSFHNGDSK